MRWVVRAMKAESGRHWSCAHARGPDLTRAHLAAFIAAHPGQGSIWQDWGKGGRLLFSPVTSEVGDALDTLTQLPILDQGDPRDCWAGWVSYDLSAHTVAALPNRDAALPALGLRRYRGALLLRDDGTYELQGQTQWIDALFAIVPKPEHRAWAYGALQCQWSKARYAEAFARIHQHLVAGDTYQINLSHPLVAPLQATAGPRAPLVHAVGSFADLCERAPAPYGCFVDVDGERAILSNSPELLFSMHPTPSGNELWTGPIKGTRPRGACPTQDAKLAQELLSSPKDAAEHLMIVDLLRNDLVRIATPGSVRAPARPSLLSLPTVHHLETKIQATLAPGKTMPDLWRALAPGGSVTGAPKRASVEIIDALERSPRGIYCGSLFYGDTRTFWASIAIRTAQARDGALHLRSGGGIVLDSRLDEEWEETLTKARAFGAGTGV